METIQYLIDLVLHVDQHLAELIAEYGLLTYAILFAIVFCETGLVVTPFLPGDSLLFAAGALCVTTELSIGVLVPLLIAAAVIGDSVNYWVGYRVGPGFLEKGKVRFIKREHLEKTQRFYERHGGKTIILARFVPIVRTFAPFVAGIGRMSYARFFTYNVVGAVVWVVSFSLLGYYFGNLPVVKQNFTLVILAIIVLSVLPIAIEVWKARSAKRAAASES
jgi:membrane-associated protein